MRKCWQLEDSSLTIPNRKALSVAKALNGSRPTEVDRDDYDNKTDYAEAVLDEALSRISFHSFFEAGDLVGVDYESYYGQGYTSNADFKALALGAEAGDYLIFRDEDDGDRTKILFDGKGDFRRLAGEVVFDD